jgi:two-component system OmpR family response regulator
VRLLVVDDEVRLAAALQRGLSREGFAVDIAHDGYTAVQMVADGEYDAVVLDLMLPGLSGYEVLRRLRRAEVWTPVLMLTAKDGEHDEADALDEGADDYLTKPFSFVVLLARIRALLRRTPTARPTVLQNGELQLDPARRTVSRRGEPVPVTTREFAVLEYLMRRPGVVVSKSELYEHVWEGSDQARDHNVVEVYVSYLRRKLGPDAVETVRGAGYRLPDAGG